jgi:hypothetical protein
VTDGLDLRVFVQGLSILVDRGLEVEDDLAQAFPSNSHSRQTLPAQFVSPAACVIAGLLFQIAGGFCWNWPARLYPILAEPARGVVTVPRVIPACVGGLGV